MTTSIQDILNELSGSITEQGYSIEGLDLSYVDTKEKHLEIFTYSTQKYEDAVRAGFDDKGIGSLLLSTETFKGISTIGYENRFLNIPKSNGTNDDRATPNFKEFSNTFSGNSCATHQKWIKYYKKHKINGVYFFVGRRRKDDFDLVLFGVVNGNDKKEIKKKIRPIINTFLNKLNDFAIVFEKLRQHRNDIETAAVRAAISQVMARNMSHNIGSHVLNNLTDGTILSKISNYECKSYQPCSALKDLKEESKIIHQLAIYNNYVKCRMDYLSDITFGTPVMHTNKKVYAELYKDFDKVRLLLDHISGLSKNFQFQINFTLNDNAITAKDDFSIALPNDLLGCQAFYNIIENVIRNTAKHNQKKSGTTTFTLNFKEITDKSNSVNGKELWYEVEIFDDVKITGNKPFNEDETAIKNDYHQKTETDNATKVKNIDWLVFSQNQKLNLSVLDEKHNNQLRNSSLGLLEMEASAAYLRKLDITNIEDDTYEVEYDKKISNKHGNLNILKAFNKNGALGYRFFVSKPTEFLFVGDFDLTANQKKELSKKGIWVRTESEFVNELQTGIVFNHQFILSTTNGIEKFKTSLPVRNIPIDANSPIVELLKTGLFENIEHWIWQEWFNKNKGSFEYINIMTSYSDKKHNQLNRYNIAISHHATTIESCKKDFGEKINAFDVLSSNALNKLPDINGKELVVYIDQLKNDNVPNHITKFKLFEAYTNTVAVIDERIQRYSNEKYLGLENKEIFSFTNVLLPIDIELASDNYTKTITKKIEAFAEKAITENKCKFLVVHYSILERMYGSRNRRIDETLIKWSEKARVVITSGRGKPPELPSKNVCYVNLSPILNAFTQVRSKYAINYLLNTARR
jgi:hypothetical protein